MLETPPPWLARALAGAAAVLVLGGVLAAATRGPDKASHHLSTAATSTTSTTSSPTTTTAPASTATTAGGAAAAGPGAAPAGAGPAGGQNLGAPGDPGQPVETKPGTYRYHISAKSSQGNDEEDTTFLVEELAAGTYGPRQRDTLKTKQGNQISEQSWRSAGVYIDRQSFNFGGGTTDCDWNPDILALAQPLATGRSWQSKSHCSTTAHTNFGDVPLELDVTLTAKVSGAERVQVGSAVVDVWVISGTLDVEGTSSGQQVISEKGTYTSKFAPKAGLEVVRHDDLHITSPQGSGEATSDRQLLDLQPS